MKDFETIKNKYPNLSDILCFVKMVKGKKMGDVQLESLFDKYVPKTDYVGTPKKQILLWLRKEVLKK